MASGIASTTRFIGILVSVAILGAVLADVARKDFVSSATQIGLALDAAREAAAHVTSGDLSQVFAAASPATHEAVRTAALSAYGAGFASAALVAAWIALISCFLASWLISPEETAPIPLPPDKKLPCKLIDCRDPL